MPIEADKKPPESKSYVERITDFSGGLNTTLSGTLLNKNEAQKADNVSYDPKGTLKPRRGNTPRHREDKLAAYTKPVTLGSHVDTNGDATLLVSTGGRLYKEINNSTKVWDTEEQWNESGKLLTDKMTTWEEPGKLKNAFQHFQDRIYTNVPADWELFNTVTPLVAEEITIPTGSTRVATSALLLHVPLASPDVVGYVGVSLEDLVINPAVRDTSYYVIGYVANKDYVADMGDCKMELCLLSDFDTTAPVEVSGTVVTTVVGSGAAAFSLVKMLIPKTLLTGVDTAKYGIALKLWDSTGARTVAMQMLFTDVYAYKITEVEYGYYAADLAHAYYMKPNDFEHTLAERISLGYKKRGYWRSAIIDLQALNCSDYGTLKLRYVSTLGTEGLINVFGWTSDSTTFDISYMQFPISPTGYLVSGAKRYLWIVIQMFNDAEVSSATLTYPITPSLSLIYSKGSANTNASIATLNGKTVIANGADTPLYWTGGTTSVLPITGAPKLSDVVVHNNRLWGIDKAYPSHVAFSNVLDATTWDSYDSLSFNPNDGDNVVALIPYGQVLIVAKQRSMAMITGDSALNYNIVWLDTEEGAVGSRSMCVAGKYLAYVSSDGIRMTDLSQSTLITDKLSASWDSLDKTMLSNSAIVYWRNKLYVALPITATGAATKGNNVVWVYDTLRGAWSVFPTSPYNHKILCWFNYSLNGTSMLLAGYDTVTGGYIAQMDVGTTQTTITSGTTAIVALEWKSKDFHFGYPERYKLFRNIYIDVEGIATADSIAVDLYVDGVKTGTFTSAVPAGAGKKYIKRILPPIYGAVLGVTLTLVIRTSCAIQSIAIDYSLKGNAPGGDV